MGDDLVAKNLREKCRSPRDFYSLLSAAILGAKAVGHLTMLINEQTTPSMMSKMLAANWKQWAVKQAARNEVGSGSSV